MGALMKRRAPIACILMVAILPTMLVTGTTEGADSSESELREALALRHGGTGSKSGEPKDGGKSDQTDPHKTTWKFKRGDRVQLIPSFPISMRMPKPGDVGYIVSQGRQG